MAPIPELGVSDQLLLDIVRTLLPRMTLFAPALTDAIDRATDAMMAERDLPVPAIEELHDFGNFLTRAAEEMFAAQARATADSGP